jgi:phenol 2-monooxygenase
MTIPREGDRVRFYLQMSEKDVMDPTTGKLDSNKVTPEKLIEVCPS